MKGFTKILIAVLLITTLIPICIGILCLFDQPGALQFFSLDFLSPESEKLLFVLGGFMLATAVLPILAIVWLSKQKPGGFTLAYIVGFIAFGRGVMTMGNFYRQDVVDTKLIATPLAIGALVLIITLIASRQQFNNNSSAKLVIHN
jgi:hypothetical protein